MFPPKIISNEVLLLHTVPLHDVKIGMWCGMNAKLIPGPIFYAKTTDFL
jgi:hypothetical protein